MRQGNRSRKGTTMAKKVNFAKKPKGRKKKGSGTAFNFGANAAGRAARAASGAGADDALHRSAAGVRRRPAGGVRPAPRRRRPAGPARGPGQRHRTAQLAEAADALAVLPGAGETVHALMTGRYDLMHCSSA